jgi:hypothetical protein
MGRAPRKFTAPISLDKALELAAKRLGVADLDYAKIRLREQLKTAEYGRDWGAQAVHPPDTRVDDLWSDPSGAWAVDWRKARASMLIVPKAASGLCFERAIIYGLWITPAIIAALAPAVAIAPKPKRRHRGRREDYDIPLIKRTMREIAAMPRQPQRLDGKDGIAEKLRDRLGDDAVPGRSRLYEIFESISQPKQSTN